MSYISPLKSKIINYTLFATVISLNLLSRKSFSKYRNKKEKIKKLNKDLNFNDDRVSDLAVRVV